MKRPLLVVAAAVVVMFLGLIVFAACAPRQNPQSAAAAPCTVDVEQAKAGQKALTGQVAGYSGDQLTNAAAIVAAGAALGLDVRDQTIGVMTAMGESSLHVLDYGDAAGPDSRGLFQQRANGVWGSYEDRMNPFTSATNFFITEAKIAGRDKMDPTEVAHLVQRNADPNHYARFWEPATMVVAAIGQGACVQNASAPTGTSKELATALVAKIDAGTLTGLSASALDQIRWAATGSNYQACGIDVRVLQIITVATETFDSVGVSSINRFCTKTLAGAGVNSRHYLAGGGHAVDFYAFNGKPTNGADANAVTLIRALDGLLPSGSSFGQEQCRAAAGTVVATVTRQFEDTCNHLHIDVDPETAAPLGRVAA